MLGVLSGALFAIALPAADGLAPLGVGLASSGTFADLVVRPAPAGTACRLLLSDAETDAPLVGASLTLHGFGPIGSQTPAPANTPAAGIAGGVPGESQASAGRFDGHYLAACPPAGEALVVEMRKTDSLGQAPANDLFAFTWPAAPVRPSSLPLPAGVGVLAVLLAAWRARRSGVGARGLAIALALAAAGSASAHGVDEAGLPVVPGAEVGLGQELQFALGFRTARVTVGSFLPPDSAGAAARSYPAVERGAVVERGGQKLVFVRSAPERFVARPVTLGWGQGPRVAVLSGLQPGELALVAGGAFLRNGGAATEAQPATASAATGTSGDSGVGAVPGSAGSDTP